MSIQKLSDIKLSLGQDEIELVKIAEKKLHKKPLYFRILKKSLDARDKNAIKYIYTIEFSDKKENIEKNKEDVLSKDLLPQNPVVIVGSGPAGLFCGIKLIRHGFKPIIIERGMDVDSREKTTKEFFKNRILNTECNVQFGEGGAGTFSDGKLNTQTHNKLNKEVLETFVEFGAPEEILWLNKPHIGSDNLKKVVKNMRLYIINNGGQVLFNTKLTDIVQKNDKITSIKVENLGKENIMDVSALVLAVGHSARDTFEMLYRHNIYMTKKNFAVGLRIEHLQSEIGFAQYGKNYKKLPAADYKLVSHTNDRSAFTFCMCPGGFVMPSTSEENAVVTNGMSNYARDGVNANSALVVQVTEKDFPGDSPLAGIAFQRDLERKAFNLGGESYFAPVQKIGDYLLNKKSKSFGEIKPTYEAGTSFANLNMLFSESINETIKFAIVDMNKRLKGFSCPDGILTGIESRTSSPLRIERDDTLQSVSLKGLYPCGEGAGYSGGITSSAADGLRTADKIFGFYKK